MRIAIAMALCTLLGLLYGCGHNERVYGNIYEGLKTRNAIINPSPELKSAEESMSYQAYESEREKLLKADDKK